MRRVNTLAPGGINSSWAFLWETIWGERGSQPLGAERDALCLKHLQRPFHLDESVPWPRSSEMQSTGSKKRSAVSHLVTGRLTLFFFFLWLRGSILFPVVFLPFSTWLNEFYLSCIQIFDAYWALFIKEMVFFFFKEELGSAAGWFETSPAFYSVCVCVRVLKTIKYKTLVLRSHHLHAQFSHFNSYTRCLNGGMLFPPSNSKSGHGRRCTGQSWWTVPTGAGGLAYYIKAGVECF